MRPCFKRTLKQTRLAHHGDQNAPSGTILLEQGRLAAHDRGAQGGLWQSSGVTCHLNHIKALGSNWLLVTARFCFLFLVVQVNLPGLSRVFYDWMTSLIYFPISPLHLTVPALLSFLVGWISDQLTPGSCYSLAPLLFPLLCKILAKFKTPCPFLQGAPSCGPGSLQPQVFTSASLHRSASAVQARWLYDCVSMLIYQVCIIPEDKG